ncbi:hypothetical protein Nepgr_016736 [Nepenthes gracilis]|uniref:Uncharacterized protein n=1 Tax=Nepenthes gracilis TaxID=150966 RepID=A0AAD3XSR7_NEPGR|nr:hypothetical protein Nepgr_016736 [Nepenthes gracilis]
MPSPGVALVENVEPVVKAQSSSPSPPAVFLGQGFFMGDVVRPSAGHNGSLLSFSPLVSLMGRSVFGHLLRGPRVVCLLQEHKGLEVVLQLLPLVSDVDLDWLGSAKGGKQTISSGGDFNSYVSFCGLQDISYDGCSFTWYNKGDGTGHIYKTLDHGIVNDQWLMEWGDYKATFLNAQISDHSPALLIPITPVHRKKCIFKFNNFLVKHVDFLKVV